MATFSSTVTITDPVVKDPKTGRGSGGDAPSCFRAAVAAIVAAMALLTTASVCAALAWG